MRYLRWVSIALETSCYAAGLVLYHFYVIFTCIKTREYTNYLYDVPIYVVTLYSTGFLLHILHNRSRLQLAWTGTKRTPEITRTTSIFHRYKVPSSNKQTGLF